MLKLFPSEKITVNGRHLHVRRTFQAEANPSLPTVILVHGFTDSGYYWSRLAADLEPYCQVLLPDLLGHGQSDPLAGVTTVESYADDVVAILDHYGIGTAGIGGHSMGGVAACAAAAKYADRFTAVMLEDPAWAPHPGPDEGDFLIRFPPVVEWRTDALKMREMSRAEVLVKVQGAQPDWHPDDWEMYISDRLAYDISIFERVDFGIRAHWQRHLAQVNVPVLLVTGEKELGGIIGDEFAAEILRIAPNGRVAKIAGAGHGIHRERYEAFRDVVVPFFTDPSR